MGSAVASQTQTSDTSARIPRKNRFSHLFTAVRPFKQPDSGMTGRIEMDPSKASVKWVDVEKSPWTVPWPHPGQQPAARNAYRSPWTVLWPPRRQQPAESWRAYGSPWTPPTETTVRSKKTVSESVDTAVALPTETSASNAIPRKIRFSHLCTAVRPLFSGLASAWGCGGCREEVRLHSKVGMGRMMPGRSEKAKQSECGGDAGAK